MSPARRILRLFCFLAFVLVATLLLLEVGLRILDPFFTEELRDREAFQREILMQHPDLPPGTITLRPDITAEFLGQQFVIGPRGLRTPQVSQEKPEGTYRVLVVGDSIAFGWGVAEHDCFPRVLERLLNAGPKPPGIERFEVINGSCPGWGVPNYYHFTLSQGLPLDPDCVAVTFINNDLTDILSQLDTWQPKQGLMTLPTWLERVYVAEAVKAVHDITLGAKGDFFLELEDSPFTTQAIDALCDKGFLPMAELVRPREFVVVDTVGNREGASLEHFANRLDALGIARIEAFLPQTNYLADYAITPTDMHPNAKGHREFAEHLYSWLQVRLTRK